MSRDGKFWLVRIPELGLSTQALRYRDVPVMAAELIEIMSGAGPGEYDLQLEVKLPSSVTDHLARAEVLRAEAGRKNAEAAAESRAAVQELLASGISQREASQLLGVSHQRISQRVRT